MRRSLIFSSIALLPAVITVDSLAAPVDQPGHQSPAPGTANDTMSAVKDTASHAYGMVSAQMTSSLKGFATEAAISDMYEVEAGKIAAQRSQDAEVKSFADQMVRAHTQTTKQLKALLVSHKDVVPPT